MLMRTKYVDFHAVPERHREIDARLENWARWASSGGGSTNVHPMFRQYRSKEERERAREPRMVCDTLDALHIERSLRKIGSRHAETLRWAYVFKGSPKKFCASIGSTLEGLSGLLQDARDAIKNAVARDSGV